MFLSKTLSTAPMFFTAWATLAALGVYFWTGVNAGRARIRHNVPAPSMEGPEDFLRCQRVHANSLEQLPLLLVPLWMCAFYLGDLWAAAGGLMWCLGRIAYALGYYRDPARREVGFITGMLACALLIGGTVWGLLLR